MKEVLIDWTRPRVILPTEQEIRRIIGRDFGRRVGYMPAPGYMATFSGSEAQGDGTAGTSTTVNSIIPAACKVTIPGSYISRIGQRFHLNATGRISNIVTTPGTLVFKFMMGPTANIISAQSRAISLNIVAKTNVGWTLDWYFTVRAIGAATACNWMHNGMWCSESVIGAPAGSSLCAALQDTPAVGTGFDSTVASVIDLTSTFSLTGNSIQVHTFGLESLN